jgi:hypothetical protein
MLSDPQVKYYMRFRFVRILREQLYIIARLLGSWVRIPSEAWMSIVSAVCCQADRSRQQADHSSRGVVPSVVRLTKIVKSR